MQSYVSVFPDFLLQSKQSHFTGSGEDLSRLDIVMHEAAHSRLPCAWAFYLLLCELSPLGNTRDDRVPALALLSKHEY